MKYICGVDESGITNNHNNLLKKILNNYELKENQKFSLITMILIKEDEYSYFKKELKILKINLLKNKKIKLHTSDFLNKRNLFLNYEISELKEFLFSFLNIIENLNFKIYQVFIDKESHLKKYKEKSIDPYFLASKYFINKISKLKLPIDLIFERRSYNLDIELLKNLYTWNYFKNDDLNIYFLNKRINDDYEIIELADFVSYFLFISYLKYDDKYFAKVKVLSEENEDLLVMIKRILFLKISNYSFKKID
ncbi:MAG: hypothetical protein HPAVJP_0920 [Candidatus Hepatoplasma vulgare]|nr:MAG: hypothetical protein HPAVJP_0920 [Candidatus Hepatoplasma sp.]